MDIHDPIAHAHPEVQRATLLARLAGLGTWLIGLLIFAVASMTREPWLFGFFVAWYVVVAAVGVVVAAMPRRRQAVLDREWARRFRELAIHDELTGLYNRRYFNSELQSQIAACRGAGAPLTIALVDLDDFKSINDTFGHAAGDMALRVAAEALLSVAPLRATVARTGGDEFAIILPGTSLADAEPVVACMRETLAAASFVLNGTAAGARRISAAFGLATLGAAVTPDQLLNQADTALYAKKRALPRGLLSESLPHPARLPATVRAMNAPLAEMLR